jgi:hypothetical protein
MLGFRGPAQPSPTLGDALNAGYLYLEVRCLGLRHAPDRCSRCGPQTEDNSDPRAGAVHAVQGLLAGAGLCVQEEPLGCSEAPEDFSE